MSRGLRGHGRRNAMKLKPTGPILASSIFLTASSALSLSPSMAAMTPPIQVTRGLVGSIFSNFARSSLAFSRSPLAR